MIGERIKKLRMEKGYSITQLAALAGISKSYLSYIERDLRNNPSLEFLGKIAKPLDTTIEFLLHENIENENEMKLIDEEWQKLLNHAISNGLNKEDFQTLQEFFIFKHWKEKKKKLGGLANGDGSKRKK
ncbi:helix-turn-helix domain-containing protein [Heyndrickxia sporothermodurans]|uniref:helix-turn-helix domain-containing protein n=1 Tax=Heyndrickxia sporothermodurans TaxID=46224 RepID=UPI002DB937EC|nr:helix-turn-helix transcriptional regulator [Heyndrickxia sporothermodurans]MEB6547604.1 helix-turn-helix domain-containing protein [Heyndrickxia sporothermodurans]MED3656307.1 helix-turn-helix transcriptional regulator [Heyndrickxia sporothermodurans]MED3780845.1 helix-turn-helix transcriptional regulator [Heyndrickxia sporothermodurans]